MEKILNFDTELIDKSKCIITYDKALMNLDVCRAALIYWNDELRQEDLDVDKYFKFFIRFDVPGFLISHFKTERSLYMSNKVIYNPKDSYGDYSYLINKIRISEKLHMKISKIAEELLNDTEKIFITRCLKAFIMLVGNESKSLPGITS